MIQPRPNRIASTIRWVPWLAAVSSSVLVGFLLRWYGDSSLTRAKDAISALANPAAVFVGFAMTAKSILLTMQESSVVKLLRARDGYRFVVAHFIDTSVLGLCTSICCVFAVALDWGQPTTLERSVACVVFGLTVGTVVSVAQTTYYLKCLLTAKPESDPSPRMVPEDLE